MYAILYHSLFALLAAFGLCALLGPLTIPMLRQLKFGQNVRSDGPKTHLKKQGTPTMGGIIILVSIIIASLLFGYDSYSFLLIALLMSGLYGIVRHPMYSVTLFLFLSMLLVLGSPFSFVIMLAYIPIIAKRIRNEEEVLEAGLPGYTEYKTRVRYKVIPYIW